MDRQEVIASLVPELVEAYVYAISGKTEYGRKRLPINLADEVVVILPFAAGEFAYLVSTLKCEDLQVYVPAVQTLEYLDTLRDKDGSPLFGKEPVISGPAIRVVFKSGWDVLVQQLARPTYMKTQAEKQAMREEINLVS